MIIQRIIKSIKEINKQILKLVKSGIEISFIICIIASAILITYIFNESANTYYIGISLLKSSLFFMVEFIICGFAFNNITKEIM